MTTILKIERDHSLSSGAAAPSVSSFPELSGNPAEELIELPLSFHQKPKGMGRKSEKLDPKAIIRKLNLKVTTQRMMMLEVLHSNDHRRHITAQELFELVSKKDSALGFATVYRFLRKLTDSSIVTEVRMGGLPARYELTPKYHHDHLTCTHCGKISEFENHKIEHLQKVVAESLGYELTGHLLELYGICSDCKTIKARV